MKPNRYVFAYVPQFDNSMKMEIIEAFSELDALKIGTNKVFEFDAEAINPNPSIEDVKDLAFDLGGAVGVMLIPA